MGRLSSGWFISILILVGLALFAVAWVAEMFLQPILPLGPVAFAGYSVLSGLAVFSRLRKNKIELESLRTTLENNSADIQVASEAYSRFVPVQFLRHLKRGSISEIQLGDQVEKTMTVLFSDIRNFTTLSEQLVPQDNFCLLNGYLGRIGPVIREFYGFIDKYVGDAVMALFDGPVDEAISAAMALQLATVDYNRTLKDRRFGPISIGVGLHSGPLMLGVIGESGRMESTVIGDTVNLASRIESLTKHYDCRILVTRTTFEAQSDPQPYLTRPIDLVQVKGRNHSVELLEILDERFDPRAPLKNELSARLAEAMMVYRRGDFFGARTLFQTLAYKDPEDTLYGIYRRRIEELIRLGAPDDWNGTTVFDVK